jgi:DNA polymerase delta subunit 2
MYFLRLAMVKPVVESIASEAWSNFSIGGEKARRVEKVLDVRQGELCWVVGTVYMDMSLKPNVLDDISKEHWITAPPPREKYISPDGGDQVMLEDESGRLSLAGPYLRSYMLCTGCIIAVIGTENEDGAFEVVDIKIPDLPRQPERWERDEGALAVAGKKVKAERPKAGKIALVSGLSISGEDGDGLVLDLLAEYLLGEGSLQDEVSQVSRLIIAGDSLSHASPIPSREEYAHRKPQKKYGYDASSYNPAPIEQLDSFLATLLPSLPVTILPGASDPAPVAIPQQPLHAALFPRSRNYANPPSQPVKEPAWFDSVTNPWEGDIDGLRVLGNSGQPIDDMYKYVDGDERVEMMEHLLRWRNGAPTAPDTLCKFPPSHLPEQFSGPAGTS